MPKSIRLGGKKVGDIMKELELRVLVNGTEIHTESGAHAKVVQSWPEFVKALPPKHARRWRPLSAAAGRAELDAAALKLAGRHKFKMPWT
jgi:hypothetical protein